MSINLSFNLQPLLEASWIIQVHLAAALLAVVAGVMQLLSRKGTARHRIMGYGWVSLMLAAAVSAIFIREINDGAFSMVHLFVPLTFFGLFGLIYHIRQRNIKRHRRIAALLFCFALITPGLFAFLPGRLLWNMFLGG